MKDHLTELGERRLQLQLRAAAQRQQLGECVHEIETRFQSGGGLLNMGSWLQKPALLAAGAALAMLLGPRRVLRLAGKAVLLISVARRVISLIRMFR